MEKEIKCPERRNKIKVKNGFNRGKQRYKCKGCRYDMHLQNLSNFLGAYHSLYFITSSSFCTIPNKMLIPHPEHKKSPVHYKSEQGY